MNQLNYKLRVLESLNHVRQAPAAGMLRAAGMSFVIYYGLHFPRPGDIPLATGTIPEVTGEMSYSDRLRPEAGLHYSTLTPVGKIPGELAAAAGASAEGVIHRSLLWIHPSFAIAAVPIVFAVPKDYIDWPYIPVERPLSVDDILGIMDLLTTPALVADFRARVREEYRAAQVSPIERSMAIQLWDLDGTYVDGTQSRPPTPYRGLEETQRYSWELSAVLSFSSDHVVKDRLWLRRTPSQVFAQVAEGFAFFDDHIVFMNNNCCLEVSHLPIDLRERSRYRLEMYGYDSSSTFIWTLETLRWFALSNLRSQYKQTIRILLGKKDLSAASRNSLLQRWMQDSAAIDQILALREHLKEPRLTAIAGEIEGLWLTDRMARDTQREMEKADTLATDLAKVRDQALEARRNTLLGVVAVALALVGIPSLVSQFGSWYDVRDWLGLTVAASLMIVLLVAVALIVRRRE